MSGKHAVVTGAGSGIGRHTAMRLARRGYFVHLLGRTAEALEQTAEQIRRAGSDACAIRSVDVSDPGALEAALKDLRELSVFVANAGICEQAAIDAPEAAEVFRRVLDVNLFAVFHGFRLLAPRLIRGASAIVVSSGLGKLGRPEYTAYTASKHAVLGLVKCLAKELAPRDITVNAVCPGWVDTEMARADVIRSARKLGISPEAFEADAREAIALKRFVNADEVAALIEFLASEDARAITGEAYNISCGEFFA